MRRTVIALVVALLVSVAPADAFSLKTPFVKTGHALKVGVKKAGKIALYGVIVVAVIELCSHGGCQT